MITTSPQPPQKRRPSNASLKALLDQYYTTYCTPDFITTDPIQFPHQFRHHPQACELVAFLTAMVSFGRRGTILATMTNLLDRMNGDPLAFLNLGPDKQQRQLAGFVYRFYQADDMAYLCRQLAHVYDTHSSLENLFMANGQSAEPAEDTVMTALTHWRQTLLGTPPQKLMNRNGLKFLLPNPALGGACKRFHMFLRWVVRHDAIDLGLWQKALSPHQLLIPLDTHVAQQARTLKLITRTANDHHTVVALTQQLRRFCADDPVKYDISLFGLGVNPAATRL